EGRLSSIVGNGEETKYTYDELGRLVNKSFANGVTQGYSYLPGGNLLSMESSDKDGQLDKYFYSYNTSGLINGISRDRRDLDAVSGQYEYKYDAIGRLTQSSLNGQVKAAYEYDAFGNRTSLTEKETRTAYKYDVLDRLVEARELNNSQAIVKTYDYDKRGNQTKEFVDGLLQKTFTFDATNMLSKVVDSKAGELENEYNGLGFRVASTRPEEKIEYLCDLSRDYYNLLERTVNGETESFIYDNNVVSMSKSGNNYYYLQDELGSPMYLTGTDGSAVSSYAFDDFGRNIDPRTGRQRKHEYTTNGNIIQPFAFTGYQEDEVSGLKFAQARFYSAENGRFASEDLVRGLMIVPETQNHYLYCQNNSKKYVDLNGKFAVLAAIATTVVVGAAIGAVTGAVVNTVSQVTKIATGKQDKFDWGSLAGSTAEGAIVGAATGFATTGIGGFAAAVIGGGLGAAANSAISQKINTGTIDRAKVAEEGIVGAVSGGLFYGAGKLVRAIDGGTLLKKEAPSLFSKAKDAFADLEKAGGKYLKIKALGKVPSSATRHAYQMAKDEVKNVFTGQLKGKLGYNGVWDAIKKGWKYAAAPATYATWQGINAKGVIKDSLRAISPIYKEDENDTLNNYLIKTYGFDDAQSSCATEG
uniref:RHS repeat-associated core domain-containing protein n=1 Tax=Pseudobutyrivibrio ruminis TaxID=46206 RepID=UPI000482566E